MAATSSPLPVLILGTLALLASLAAALLSGAFLAGWAPILPDWALALTVAVGVLGPPLWVSRRLIQALAARSPRPTPITLSMIFLWSVALLAVPFGLRKDDAQQALSNHNDWWLMGADAPMVRTTLKFLVTTLGGPTPTEAPAETPAETPALPISKEPLSAHDLFASRADSVVVIQTQLPAKHSLISQFLGGNVDKSLAEAMGSGFIVRADGLIVTNNHVIQGAERARVRLKNGTILEPITVLARLPDRDLALLSVPMTGLSVSPLASQPAGIGDTTFAIGSPLGLEYTFTQGMISATRDMEGTTFLQMQTIIAPGSSGGPLFNVYGEVVGVNTAIQDAGLGFALDVHYVQDLLALPRENEVLTPYLPGPQVTAVTITGVVASPIARNNLAQLASTLAREIDTCISTLPEGAYANITFPKGDSKTNLLSLKLKKKLLDSNLAPQDQACTLGMMSLLVIGVTSILGQELKNESDPYTVELLLNNLHAAPEETRSPEARTLRLTVAMSVPPEAPKDAGAPPTSPTPTLSPIP